METHFRFLNSNPVFVGTKNACVPVALGRARVRSLGLRYIGLVLPGILVIHIGLGFRVLSGE